MPHNHETYSLQILQTEVGVRYVPHALQDSLLNIYSNCFLFTWYVVICIFRHISIGILASILSTKKYKISIFHIEDKAVNPYNLRIGFPYLVIKDAEIESITATYFFVLI